MDLQQVDMHEARAVIITPRETRASSRSSYTFDQVTKCLGVIGKRTEQLENTAKNLQGKVAVVEKILEERVSGRMEQTMGGLQSRVHRIEGMLQEKADCDQLRSLSQSLVGNEKSVASVEQALSVSTDRMRQVEYALTVLDKGLENVEKSVGAKVDTSAMDEFKGLCANNANSIHKKLHSKVDSAQLDELHDQLAKSTQAMEQMLRGKVAYTELSEIRASLARIAESKADVTEVQQLSHSVSKLETLGADLERAMTNGYEKMHASDQKIAVLQKDMSKYELALRDKSSASELEKVRSVVERMHSITTACNLALQDCVKLKEMQDIINDHDSFSARICDLEDAVKVKVDVATTQQISHEIGSVQSVVAEVKENFSTVVHLEQLEQSMARLAKDVQSEQAVQMKAAVAELHDVKSSVSGLESRYLTVERSLRESAGVQDMAASELNDVKTIVSSLESKHQIVERSLRESAGIQDLAQLKSMIKDTQAQIARNDKMIYAKADDCSVKQLSKDMNEQYAMMRGLRLNVSSDLDAVQRVESALANVGDKIQKSNDDCRAWCSQYIDEKIASIHQHLKSTIENLYSSLSRQQKSPKGQLEGTQAQELFKEVRHMQSQIKSIEQNVQANCSDLQQLRSTSVHAHSARSFEQRRHIEQMESDQARDVHHDIKRLKDQVADLQQICRGSKMNDGFGHPPADVSRKLEALEGAVKSHTDEMHKHAEQVSSVCAKGSRLQSEINSMEAILANMQEAVSSKASKTEVENLHKLCTNVEEVAELEKSARSTSNDQVVQEGHQRIEALEAALRKGSDRMRVVEALVLDLQNNAESIQSPSTRSEGFDQVPDLIDQIKRVEMASDQKVQLLEASVKAAATGQVQDILAQIKQVELASDQKMQSLEASVQQALDSNYGSKEKGVDMMVDNLKDQVKELEQGVTSRVAVADFTQLKGVVSGLQAQMTSLGQFAQQDTANMDSVQQLKRGIINVQAQVNSLDQSFHEKAGMEHLQKLRGSVTGMQSQVAGLEQKLQDKAGTEQMHQVNSAVAGLQSKVNSLEQHKADSSNLQQLSDGFSTWQSKAPTAERVQQLEATITSLGQHITRIEQSTSHGKALKLEAQKAGVADVHTQVELQHFKGIIAGMERKVTDLEQELHDKISTGQLQQIQKKIMGVDTKIVEVDQKLHDKASVSDMQSMNGSMQAKISNVEQAVTEKLGADQLVTIKAGVASAQAQAARVEQALHDKVCINQMQQMKGTIANTLAKVGTLDQALLEKAGTGQLQQLKDEVSNVQGRLTRSIGEAVANQMKQLCPEPSQDSASQRFKRLRNF